MQHRSEDKFLSPRQAGARLASQASEFVVVRNPKYVFPDDDIYPLAPRIAGPVRRLVAVVQDMDGTTTTTETLCLHSLETMVRRVTGRLDRSAWSGLNHERDYPHVIGNSTTRHVEYLARTYSREIVDSAMARALLDAAAWTLALGADPLRRAEARNTLEVLGWSRVLESDSIWGELLEAKKRKRADSQRLIERIIAGRGRLLRISGFVNQVRACIEIYYQRYHEILREIERGCGDKLAAELTGGRRLIEPMSGVGVFLALVKGWLGAKAGVFYDMLRDSMRGGARLPPAAAGRARLAALGRLFRRRPLKVAIVTSSIKYEAGIVLEEVVSVLRREARCWPACRWVADRLEDVSSAFDAVVTASDSSEIRLKPHRDLYSIALQALGVEPRDFRHVLGFEDSESGVTAIRAAGIGLCVAVPFADTAGHDLRAAAHVLRGGLPEAILGRNLFLRAGREGGDRR